MANAKKCDRCKSYYDLYDNVANGATQIEFIRAFGFCVKKVDLCPDCMRQISEWVKGAFMEDKEGQHEQRD